MAQPGPTAAFYNNANPLGYPTQSIYGNAGPATQGLYGTALGGNPTTQAVYGTGYPGTAGPTTQAAYGTGIQGRPATQGVYSRGYGNAVGPATQTVYGSPNGVALQGVYGAGSGNQLGSTTQAVYGNGNRTSPFTEAVYGNANTRSRLTTLSPNISGTVPIATPRSPSLPLGSTIRPGVAGSPYGNIQMGVSQAVYGAPTFAQVTPAVQVAHAPPTKVGSRIEYIPYQRSYTDYETKQIVSSMWVPVQRKCLNYYAIENITEFIPKQVEDVRYELVPEQEITYRVQYRPVERKLVHLPRDENAYYREGVHVDGGSTIVDKLGYGDYAGYGSYGGYGGYEQEHYGPVPGYQQLPSRYPRRAKTNYVTSEGYVPGMNNYSGKQGDFYQPRVGNNDDAINREVYGMFNQLKGNNNDAAINREVYGTFKQQRGSNNFDTFTREIYGMLKQNGPSDSPYKKF